MNKKILLLAIFSTVAFSSTTGNLNLGFVPKVPIDNKGKADFEYELPYNLTVNLTEIPLTFGIDNKDLLNKEDIINNQVNLWGEYTFNKEKDNETKLRLNTGVELPENSIKVKTGANLKYQKNISNNLKYNFEAEYLGNKFLLDPNHLILNNKLTYDKLEMQFNFLQKFEGKIDSLTKINQLVDFYSSDKTSFKTVDDKTNYSSLKLLTNYKYNDFKFGLEYGMDIINSDRFRIHPVVKFGESEEDAKREIKPETLIKNDLVLGIEYSKELPYINIESKLKQNLKFAFIGKDSVKYLVSSLKMEENKTSEKKSGRIIYEIDFENKVSKELKYKSLVFTPSLGLNSKLGFALLGGEDKNIGNSNNIYGNIKLLLNADFKVNIIDKLDLLAGLKTEVLFKAEPWRIDTVNDEYKLNKLEYKKTDLSFNLGLEYQW